MEFIPLHYLHLDQWIGGVFGIVTGFIVQGEVMMFFVLMFQNLSDRERVVYDLNPFHHMDLSTLPVILLTGWGWGKKRVAVPPYFPQHRITRSMIHLAAPMGNLCFVGVLGSIYMFFPVSILKFVIQINSLIAMANFMIPIPPMALGRAICTYFPELKDRFPAMERTGALLITVLVLLDYWTRAGIWQSVLLPPALFISRFILAG